AQFDQADSFLVVLPPGVPGVAALLARGRVVAERNCGGRFAFAEAEEQILGQPRLLQREIGQAVDQNLYRILLFRIRQRESDAEADQGLRVGQELADGVLVLGQAYAGQRLSSRRAARRQLVG